MNEKPLPLFPLPLILFPGTLMPLHIFEERYRRMVADLQEGDGEFGILWHDPDEHGPFMNERGRVGTVARIRRHQPLPDGRSLILVRGVERFSIVQEVQGETPYYQARVKPYEDLPASNPEALQERRTRALELFRTVLKGTPHAPEALPDFRVDEEISFKLAAAVRMDPFWQQELLESTDEVERLTRLTPVLQVGLERWWEEEGPQA